MEDLIKFESSLYLDLPFDGNYDNDNIGFYVDRIVVFPSLRPFSIDKVVRFCEDLKSISNFRQQLLKESIKKCPVLVFRLLNSGFLEFSEISPFLGNSSYITSFYFRKEIPDFEKHIKTKEKPIGLENSFVENDSDIDGLIQYGYLPGSIEYSLKYDDVETFRDLFANKPKKVKWSPFEWSRKPKSLGLLSFSSFFGSIQCFKHMLMNGYKIDDASHALSVCSGNFDLFRLCSERKSLSSEQLCLATEFYHFPLMEYILENGVDIHAKNSLKVSPIHVAAEKGHIGIIDYFFKNRCYLMLKNNRGMSPLHFAAGNGHINVIKYLLNKRAKINDRSSWIYFI